MKDALLNVLQMMYGLLVFTFALPWMFLPLVVCIAISGSFFSFMIGGVLLVPWLKSEIGLFPMFLMGMR